MIIGEPFIDKFSKLSDDDYDSFARRRNTGGGGAVRRRPVRSLVSRVRNNVQVRRQNRVNNFGLVRRAAVVNIQDQNSMESLPDNGASMQPDATNAQQPSQLVTPVVNNPMPDPEIDASEDEYYFFQRKKKEKKKTKKKRGAAPDDKIERTDTNDRTGKDATAAAAAQGTGDNKDANATNTAAQNAGDKKEANTDAPKDKAADTNKPADKSDADKPETKADDQKKKKPETDVAGMLLGFGCLLVTAGIAIYTAISVTNFKHSILTQQK